MAFNISKTIVLQFLLIAMVVNNVVSAGRVLPEIFPFKYHNGPLLTGRVSINLIWYGHFTTSQRSIISDFVTSLSSSPQSQPKPSVANWVGSVQKYNTLIKSKTNVQFFLGIQTLDEKYSLGKSLKLQQIQQLAAKAAVGSNQLGTAINVVLTSSDVAVEGFCSSRCGTHGSLQAGKNNTSNQKFTYIWVGNSETQCPGQCAWPFHKPIYGPQGPPLVAPNNDVGIDGMVINLATLLAGTATNPFGNGYYQGPATAPLEAATACPGIFGKGAYPGYAGNLLVDPATKASYNANGINKRKFLLPALFDPASNSCATLV